MMLVLVGCQLRDEGGPRPAPPSTQVAAGCVVAVVFETSAENCPGAVALGAGRFSRRVSGPRALPGDLGCRVPVPLESISVGVDREECRPDGVRSFRIGLLGSDG